VKDAMPYICRDEWLTDYVNVLFEENAHDKGRSDRDKRMLIELKKILEIEGLLDACSPFLMKITMPLDANFQQ